MRTLVDEKMTVREMVRRFPQVRQALEEMGIDYCCGGDVSLQEAAASQGVAVDALVQALDEATHTATGPEFRDWSIASAAELLDHIVSTHHEYMRRELPRLSALLERVKEAHPAHRPMLERLDHIFAHLREEIELHLRKEEQVLFPLIRRIEADAGIGRPSAPQPIPVANPILQMEREHDAAGQSLAQMRRLTHDYSLPPDACMSFKGLYDGLQAMEADLREHIHLENNILFPKASELERA